MQSGQQNLLSIYFTAGFPNLDDTQEIIKVLEQSGADLIEIGMPYSDPMADGPTIQKSSQQAIRNGMTLDLLFEQLESLKGETTIPLVYMGYINQIMQYGEQAFFKRCKEAGIDGLILPDLPIYEYERHYQQLINENGLTISFLITPQTSPERIRKIDELSTGFIYMVADNSITGAKKGISEEQIQYFKRIRDLELSTPRLIGFGISDHQSFTTACRYARGTIIGSAFIKAITDSEYLEGAIREFVDKIRGDGKSMMEIKLRTTETQRTHRTQR